MTRKEQASTVKEKDNECCILLALIVNGLMVVNK